MTIQKAKSLHLLFISLSAVFLAGCEDPFDCIVDDRPVLNTENLRHPVLNQVFESSISVSIKNNTHDDDYDYTWRLTGQLPPGVEYFANGRIASFSGTATSLGQYPYSISVDVGNDDFWLNDDAVNASDLCRQNVTRDFTMIVAPL